MDTSIIVGLIGRQGAGKDSVAGYLNAHYSLAHLKFAGPLKSATREIGLDPDCRESKEVPHDVSIQIEPNPRNYPISHLIFGTRLEEAFRLLHEALDPHRIDQMNQGYYCYTVTPRKLQQAIGTEVGRALEEDLWVRAALDYSPERVVFSDVRFINEAAACDILLYVDRPGTVADTSHESEKLTESVHYLARGHWSGTGYWPASEITEHDLFTVRSINRRELAVVYNHGTLEDLSTAVDLALKNTRHRDVFGV